MLITIGQMCCQWVITRTNDAVAMTWVKCRHSMILCISWSILFWREILSSSLCHLRTDLSSERVIYNLSKENL